MNGFICRNVELYGNYRNRDYKKKLTEIINNSQITIIYLSNFMGIFVRLFSEDFIPRVDSKLFHHRSCVFSNWSKLCIFLSISGVLQGSKLGPLRFLSTTLVTVSHISKGFPFFSMELTHTCLKLFAWG